MQLCGSNRYLDDVFSRQSKLFRNLLGLRAFCKDDRLHFTVQVQFEIDLLDDIPETKRKKMFLLSCFAI